MLIDKKNPSAHQSRRGVERFILEHQAFTRSFETKDQGLFGGKGKDLAARALTVGGFISQASLDDETLALNEYIGTLCDELVEKKFIPEYARDELAFLLMEMTQTDPTKRPTMNQVAERFDGVFSGFASDTDTASSASSGTTSAAASTTASTVSGFASSYASRLGSTQSARKPVLVRGAEMTPLGHGKVNVVYNVTYEEHDLISGQMQKVTRVFKPDQPVDATMKEKLWGSAKGSGIPVGKDANLPARAVASSLVDRKLFGDQAVSVNTRFAMVNGQRGILMDKAEGASPKVIDQKERQLTTTMKEFQEMIGGEEVTSEVLNFFARMVEADRVEVRLLPDGTPSLVAVNKEYENFSPGNLTTAEGLLKLQVLDIICGQVDRHPGNYFIDDKGKVSAIDQDCSFGVNAMPKGVDVRNQPSLGGIVPNMGSLMLRMPGVITGSVQERILALWDDAEGLKASLQGLITGPEIKKTLERLEMLVNHISNPDTCMIVRDDALIGIAKDMEGFPEAQRYINSDNSYWGREVYKFRSGETNLNYLRSNAL